MPKLSITTRDNLTIHVFSNLSYWISVESYANFAFLPQEVVLSRLEKFPHVHVENHNEVDNLPTGKCVMITEINHYTVKLISSDLFLEFYQTDLDKTFSGSFNDFIAEKISKKKLSKLKFDVVTLAGDIYITARSYCKVLKVPFKTVSKRCTRFLKLRETGDFLVPLETFTAWVSIDRPEILAHVVNASELVNKMPKSLVKRIRLTISDITKPSP